jgi:3-oxoacyl-[acyl-carrier protein] reductase
MHDFRGKAVLVTGSTRGIGRAVAVRLLELGATVGVHGRDPSAVQRVCASLDPGGKRVIPLAADFADPGLASQVVRDFAARAGRLDGLVNNAGAGKALPFRAITLTQWRATFAVNVEAALLATQAAYHVMREHRSGCIVNIASLAAHGPGKWMGADYAAAKAALVSMTRTVAYEAARFGIRVNAVSPGMVETDMTAAIPPESRAALGIPLGRFAAPAEVAETVVFLLSEDAAYIAGEVVQVNGGLDTSR